MSDNITKIFKYHWLPKPLLCRTLETIYIIFMVIPNIFTWYIKVYFKMFILYHVLFILKVYLYTLWLFTNFNFLFSDNLNVWIFLKCKFQGLFSEYLLISLSFVVQMICEKTHAGWSKDLYQVMDLYSLSLHSVPHSPMPHTHTNTTKAFSSLPILHNWKLKLSFPPCQSVTLITIKQIYINSQISTGNWHLLKISVTDKDLICLAY